jgi:selenophosphate synthetase-related protein
VLARFAARDLAATVVGDVDATRKLMLRQGSQHEELWDLQRDPFICEAADSESDAQVAHA